MSSSIRLEHLNYLTLNLKPSTLLKIYVLVLVGLSCLSVVILLKQNLLWFIAFGPMLLYVREIWQRHISLTKPSSITYLQCETYRKWQIKMQGKLQSAFLISCNYKCRWFVILSFRVSHRKKAVFVLVLIDSIPQTQFQLLFNRLA